MKYNCKVICGTRYENQRKKVGKKGIGNYSVARLDASCLIISFNEILRGRDLMFKLTLNATETKEGPIP